MYQFEHIVCATDFSEASRAALRVAARIAHPQQGHITILYVDEHEKTPLGYFELSAEKKTSYKHTVEDFSRDQYQKILSEENLDPKHTALVVRYGTAYKEIITEAEQSSISAVALTTRGLGNSSPHLLGRTAERIVRLCRTPVLTVHPNIPWRDWQLKTILCPTDFSEFSNYALPYALSLAWYFQATLILLHVTDLATSKHEKLIDKFPDLTLYHKNANDIRIERLIGKDIEPENTIVVVTTTHNVDCIVMGTHGARGMRTVQIGNTTEEVIRRVEVPVLSITHPTHRTVFPRRFTEDY